MSAPNTHPLKMDLQTNDKSLGFRACEWPTLNPPDCDGNGAAAGQGGSARQTRALMLLQLACCTSSRASAVIGRHRVRTFGYR